jgi:hypothetical protein
MPAGSRIEEVAMARMRSKGRSGPAMWRAPRRGRLTAAFALCALVVALAAAAPAGATSFNFVRTFGSGASTWVAVDSANHFVYVTDTANNRVKRFNFDGTAANFSAGPGSGSNIIPRQFKAGTCSDSPSVCFSQPEGVAVDSSGNLFVANNEQNDVTEFSSTGAFVREFGGSDNAFDPGTGGGAGSDQLGEIKGLAVDSSGNVYAVDNTNGRIVEFNPAQASTASGGFVQQFGSESSTADPTLAGNGKFWDPEGIAVDSSGNSYITDGTLERVTKFDSTGTFVTKWGTPNASGTSTQALGRFNNPLGIAWSGGDGSATPASVFVVDNGNQRVQQFTPTGGNVDAFGMDAATDGNFQDPVGIAAVNIGTTGTNLYVADRLADPVQQFAPNQPPSNTTAPVVTGTPQQGQTLTTDNGSWTNSPSSFAYDWKRCNSAGASCVSTGVTQQNYPLTSADVTHTIESCVTAHNTAGDSASAACSTATAQVQPPPPPVNQTPPALTGTAGQGQVITTDNGTWSNSPTSFTYQWQRCDSAGNNCNDIGGAMNSAYTLTQNDVGMKVRSVVFAHNAASSAGTANSTPTDVVVGPPAAPTTAPSISGTAQSGQTLTASRGSWPNDASNSYTYQWERCDASGASCADILSGAGQTYTATDNDVGFTLRVRVTASNAAVPTTSAESGPTAVVAAAPVTGGTGGGSGGGTGGGGGSSPVSNVSGTQVTTPSTPPSSSTVLTTGVPVSVVTVSGARVQAALLVDGKTAKKAGLGNGKHSVIVGEATTTSVANGDAHLKLKLTRKAKAALKKLKSYKLVIRITVTDPSGAKFTITRTVTIRHHGKK